MKIAFVVGSLRKDSINLKVAKYMAGLLGAGNQAEVITLNGLDFYNEEEEGANETYKAFREKIKRQDAIVFVTPEYNRSLPGVLKNAIDVGSRPYGDAAWSGKPAAVITITPGALGGVAANHALRQTLVFLDMPTLQQPEAYIGGIGDKIDGEGNITDESLKGFLKHIVQSFEAFASKFVD